MTTRREQIEKIANQLTAPHLRSMISRSQAYRYCVEMGEWADQNQLTSQERLNYWRESIEQLQSQLTASKENLLLATLTIADCQARETKLVEVLKEALVYLYIDNPDKCENCEPGNAWSPEYICGGHKLIIKVEDALEQNRKAKEGK